VPDADVHSDYVVPAIARPRRRQRPDRRAVKRLTAAPGAGGQVALRVRLWRSQRDLARIRRGLLEQPPALVYSPAPWGSRPLR
jgi:hypothetical protein